MSTQSRVQRIQGKLDAATRKWWLYLLLLLLFFIPAYVSKGYDPRQSIDLTAQALSDPLLYAFPVLMPIAKAIPVILIAGVMMLGNRMRGAFNVYVALLYLALAFLQTTAVPDMYGLVILSGNLAVVLIVGLVWVWEVVAQCNDFTPPQRPLWRWWVAALAVLALLSPVDASTMSPDFSLVRLLTNEAGLTFCMMTPVVLAVLTLYYPVVNRAVLRVSSFVGILLGLVNMLVWFVLQPWGWCMGVMHIPLLLISVYAFVLAHLRAEGVPPGVTPLAADAA